MRWPWATKEGSPHGVNVPATGNGYTGSGAKPTVTPTNIYGETKYKGIHTKKDKR